MGLTALAFALAGLLRQNGLILSVAGAVAIAWAWSANSGWRSSIFSALIWLGAVAVATLALSTYAQPQGADRPDDAGIRGLRIVQTYDLVGAAAHAPLPLSHIDAFDRTLDDQIRAEAKAAWSPERVDVLDNSALSAAMQPIPGKVIRQEWLDLITQRPGLYLQVRLADFRQVFATPVIDACLPVHLGVSGPASAMSDLKLPQRWVADDTRLYNYVTWFLDTPAYSHISYAIVALVVGLILLWRRDPADLAIAGLIGGALAFAASFFVISIACDYRYLYLVDLAAITGSLYLAIDPDLSRPRARRRARD
jgi:hypothetical protein